MYMLQKQLMAKKNQKCLTRHVQMVCSYITSHRIYRTYCHWREELFLQAAVNHRQQLTGDPLPSVVQFENLENQIYQCAPGENNIPKYTSLDNDFEVLAFPDHFPYGGGGYHSAYRKVKLPIRKYFQQRLLNIDGRFVQNIEYLFCAQYIADINQIEGYATLAIILSEGRTLGGHKITAAHL